MEPSKVVRKETAGEGFARFLKWLCNPSFSKRSVDSAIAIQREQMTIDEEDDLQHVEECFVEVGPAQSQRVRSAAQVVEGSVPGYEPLKIQRTRAVRAKKKGKFVRYLVLEARAEFGLPKTTEANRLMVQHFLLKACKEWGVCTSHAVKAVTIAVPLVFVPTEEDVIANAMCHTYETVCKVNQTNHRQGEGYFNNTFGWGGKRGLAFSTK